MAEPKAAPKGSVRARLTVEVTDRIDVQLEGGWDGRLLEQVVVHLPRAYQRFQMGRARSVQPTEESTNGH